MTLKEYSRLRAEENLADHIYHKLRARRAQHVHKKVWEDVKS